VDLVRVHHPLLAGKPDFPYLRLESRYVFFGFPASRGGIEDFRRLRQQQSTR
jgi:hypothetical protein